MKGGIPYAEAFYNTPAENHAIYHAKEYQKQRDYSVFRIMIMFFLKPFTKRAIAPHQIFQLPLIDKIHKSTGNLEKGSKELLNWVKNKKKNAVN